VSADLSVEQRLRLVEDRLELIDLEGAYGRYYDSRDAERWSGLFVEDGVYEGRQLPGMAPQNAVRGRANLAAFCSSEPLNGMHTMHVPQLTLDGDEAVGRVHFTFDASGTDAFGRRSYRSVTGYYDIAYVRTSAGWRIRRRITTYLQAHSGVLHDYEPSAADLTDLGHLPAGAPFSDARS
jgi:hypothetical protein